MWAAIEPIFHTLASSSAREFDVYKLYNTTIPPGTRELDGDLIAPSTGNPQQAKHAQTDSKFKRSQQKRCFIVESVEFRLAI